MDENRWIANVFMVCPAHLLIPSVVFASQMSGNPRDNSSNFFSIPLTDNGLTVTHWAAHSRIRKVVLDQFSSVRTMFPGSIYCVTSHDEGGETMTVNEFLEQNNLSYCDEEFLQNILAKNVELPHTVSRSQRALPKNP